ncbi:MAG: pyridoxamine 5'-phosphate oxidase family protein [Saprospiraceae bacterium]
MERFTTLESFSDQCWRLLLNGTVKKNDPLRLPVLGTAHHDQAHLRIAVLRKVDVAHRRLIFYTDFRSAKVTHLQQHPHLTCLFYHPKKQIQIRTEGGVHLHHQDELAKLHWDQLPLPLRKPYAPLLLPGSANNTPTDGSPDFWQPEMNLNETEYAFAHFAVIICTVDHIEGLLLHPQGHQRAQFHWAGAQWESTWLIP